MLLLATLAANPSTHTQHQECSIPKTRVWIKAGSYQHLQCNAQRAINIENDTSSSPFVQGQNEASLPLLHKQKSLEKEQREEKQKAVATRSQIRSQTPNGFHTEVMY